MQGPDDRAVGVSRFGSFELDVPHGELRKKGVRVRLEGQPLQILTMLIARSGEPVSRDELREALWPTETFGDFERNLNSAVKRLRAALDDSGYAPRYIERLPKRGYRLLVPVIHADNPRDHATNGTGPHQIADLVESEPLLPPPVSEPEEVADALTPFPAAPLPERRRRSTWRIALLAIAGSAVLAASAYAYGRWSAERARTSIRSIAVLPFDAVGVSASEASSYTAFGLTDAVTTEISKLGGIRVASATSARWSRQTGRSLPEIAQLLKVDAVLEGTVTQEGTNVRVTAQLVDAATDTHLWADTYTRQANNLLSLQTEIAQAVAREVRLTLAPAKPASSIPMVAIVDPVLERAYLEGRYHASRGTTGSWERARQAFERALVRRPKHAPSHAGLADLYLASETLPPSEALPKARQHAMTALGLNDKLGGTHATLGIIAFYDWDWDGARRSLERALELDPTDLRSIRSHARVIGALGFTNDALAEIRRAAQMDPVSIVTLEGQVHEELQARQYERANSTAQRMLALDARDPRGYEQVAASTALLGRYPDCLTAIDEGTRIAGRTAPFVALETYCLARAGRHHDATARLAELDTLAENSYVAPYFQAIAEVGLGQLDRAVERLERGFATHGIHMVEIKMSPWLDPLRGMPRVQKLLRDMRFPE